MRYGSCIESLGVCIPDQLLSTQQLVARLRLSTPLKLELLTGIKERRVCGPGEDAVSLGENAALDCLKHSRYMAPDIQLVIFCAISKYAVGLKYMHEPAVSLVIKEKLGCTRAICFDITNACAGMLSGFHVASDFIERGVVENCLIVSGEFITSLTQNAIENITSPQSLQIASLTLGDAGGAAILCRSTVEKGFLSSKFVTLGKFSGLCIGSQSPTQQGGVMETHMKDIHDASIYHAPKVMEEALAEAGLSIDQIDYLIPHQTSKQAIRAGEDYFFRYFGKMARNVVSNLEKMGNTASTSHTLALYRLLKEGELKRGDRIMFLSFASGLVIGVVIFVIDDLAERYGSNH